MKHYFKNHPIITAILLGVLITVISIALSIVNGNKYCYRINNDGDTITDVKLQQLKENGEPIYLLKQSSIDYGKDSTIVYFDAVNPGSGIFSISYKRHTPDGEIIEIMENTPLLVSKLRIIYVGEGIYNLNGIPLRYYGITLYSFLLILYFIGRRHSLSKTNRYSYAYISTWSGQLFFTAVFLVYAITVAISIIHTKYVDVHIMSEMTRSLMLFMTLLTCPLVFIFAITITISNFSLMRHEGKRINNMLGIITGIGLLGAIVVVVVLFVLFRAYGRENAFIAILYSIANALYIIFLSVLSGAIISGLQAGYHKPAMEKDYIIILGCAIRDDGGLFPLIKGRVDRAIEFWKAQELKTGKKAVFVPSGGKGSDEIIAEGEAMKRYLIEQGIDEKYILAETNSTTTYENMKFSKELIDSINPTAKVAFSTTNYHVMRGGILAEKAGLNAEGMGAPTKWYFWPNALLREVVGMFASQPKIQIIMMLILVLFAGFAGYMYFLFT